MFRWWQRRTRLRGESLVGRWKLVRVDGTFDVGAGVTLLFADDGTATSILHEDGHDQIIHLRYAVAGATLVTTQQSQPGTERTRIHLEASGHLVLDYGPARLWFLRVGKQPR